jgi:dephospho-CoA kinase
MTGHWAVVLDIPLLFEGPLHLSCGTTMVVAVTDPKVQMDRLRARDSHLTKEDASNRVMSQGDVREKAARALARGQGSGVVVWNDGDREQLKREIDRVMHDIRAASPSWWTWLSLLCPAVGMTSATWAMIRNYIVDGRWLKQQQEERAKL